MKNLIIILVLMFTLVISNAQTRIGFTYDEITAEMNDENLPYSPDYDEDNDLYSIISDADEGRYVHTFNNGLIGNSVCINTLFITLNTKIYKYLINELDNDDTFIKVSKDYYFYMIEETRIDVNCNLSKEGAYTIHFYIPKL